MSESEKNGREFVAVVNGWESVLIPAAVEAELLRRRAEVKRLGEMLTPRLQTVEEHNARRRSTDEGATGVARPKCGAQLQYDGTCLTVHPPVYPATCPQCRHCESLR